MEMNQNIVNLRQRNNDLNLNERMMTVFYTALQ